MRDNIAAGLKTMRDALEEMKSTKSKAEGAVAEQLRRLKEDLGLNSVDEAEAAVKTLKVQREEVSADLTAEYKKLESDYDWDTD